MLKNVTIKARLIFVVGFLSLMCVVGAAIGLTSLYHANETLRTNYASRLVPISHLARIAKLVDQQQVSLAYAVNGDARAISSEIESVERNVAHIRSEWDAFKRSQGDANANHVATVAQHNAAFMSKGLQPTIEAIKAADMEKAMSAVRTQLNPLAADLSQSIANLIEANSTLARQEYEANQRTYILVRNSCLAGMLFAVMLGGLICVWLLRAIVRPLEQAVQVARSVAAGDLTHDISVRSGDETGQLLDALRHMTQSLTGIVASVRTGTETIATASYQIAGGNADLSARTESQAGALEETASSMEELTATVRQNAESAVEANELAVSASAVATRGGAVVAQVVETMGSINASARKIVDIISVIDSIAFQTNILALNAAVEAARAGEQGKGFAVVAGEVRHLAQRSAAAARQVKELIDDSVTQVESGAVLVDQAGVTMQEIVASVRRVTDIMGEISVASKEQTDGIQQVNQAINQMDTVTQQNAALVEQASAAAQSLQEQAIELSNVVGIFKLNITPANAVESRFDTVPSEPALPQLN